MSADIIVFNGKIITVDRDFSIARAVAVKDNKIVAVGDNNKIKALAGRQTKALDLEGKTMLPGINDAHIHASLYWGSRPPVTLDVGYPKVKSIRDIINMVGEQAKKCKPGKWIRGTGLNLGNLKECMKEPIRYPTRWDLDLVSPVNPVCLGVIPFSLGEHVTWLNTMALEMSGITKSFPNFPGCEVVKDKASGEPTGLLKGAPLEEVVASAIPELTRKQKRVAILTAIKELNSLGITSITEGALGPGARGYQYGLWDEDCIDIYRDLANTGNLSLRVGIMMLFTPYGSYNPETIYRHLSHFGTKSSMDPESVRIAGVKLFADGIPLNRTAWMYEEYTGGGNGRLIFSGETDEERYSELMKIVAYCHKLGFRVGVHVTGDRAIDACISSFVQAESEEPKKLRHYIIHGDFISDQGARLMAEYGIGASVQPALADIVVNFLPYSVGKERAAKYGCLRTLLDAGVHVAAGSDAPVTYPDWKAAVQSIVSRDYPVTGGRVRRVTVEEAIRMFTLEGAWQDCAENIKGSIEEGKLADFCVLDEDILTVAPQRIKDIRTLLTIVNGEIVYDAGLGR
jgi:predicted amidohydrolase YtcJ